MTKDVVVYKTEVMAVRAEGDVQFKHIDLQDLEEHGRHPMTPVAVREYGKKIHHIAGYEHGQAYDHFFVFFDENTPAEKAIFLLQGQNTELLQQRDIAQNALKAAVRSLRRFWGALLSERLYFLFTGKLPATKGKDSAI